MAKRIVVIAGNDAGSAFDLPATGPLIIGRSKSTAHPIADREVSRVHCKFETKDGIVVVSDLKSTGGTFVNGRKIQFERLQPGDVVRLGNTELKIEGVEEGTTFQPAKGGVPVSQMAAPPAGQHKPPKAPMPHVPARPAPEKILSVNELVGQVISHYWLEEILARGRTGVVFRATDLRDGQPVAFKVLKAELMDKEPERRRFIRAMKTVLPLDHPNIVRVLGAGQKHGLCWISMEYVEGVNLTTTTQKMGVACRLDWRHVFRVGHDIGQALRHIYEHNIVHRNITPTNILMRSQDRLAKLNDLMLAKALEGSCSRQISSPGELLGDLPFLPPERTLATADDDVRSDIYSLGATLYTVLTGRPPCDGGSTIKTLKLIREVEPERPEKFQLSTPPPICGMIMKMLAKRPDQRFQTPADFLDEVNRIARVLGTM